MIPVYIENILLIKSVKAFSKPSGLKCGYFCQGCFHFCNRRHAKRITLGREKALLPQKLV